MSELGYKINKYFYMDANQKILKYERYCVISDCKKTLHLIMRMKKILYIVISIN